MIRRWLVGTLAGRLALRFRDMLDLLTAGREAIGTVANDQLAGLIVSRLLDGKGTFVDVGAHIGSVIAEVRHHAPQADIIAVEAIPEKAQRLRDKFRGVRVECCALADREGTGRFFVDLDRSGYSSLAPGKGRRREIETILRTLDDLVGGTPVDVIKIDVEGAELGVLRGSAAVIAASRPTIMFESGPEAVLGYDKAALWGFLNERDYAVFIPGRLAHEAPPLTLEGFLDSHHYPRRTTNYFAIPLENVGAIRARARRILKIQ